MSKQLYLKLKVIVQFANRLAEVHDSLHDVIIHIGLVRKWMHLRRGRVRLLGDQRLASLPIGGPVLPRRVLGSHPRVGRP